MKLNATELAQRLGVSKPRVSQYVSSGVLAGCYEGDGRSRRFDLELVQQALLGSLDAGQMLGNGAATKQVLRTLESDGSGADPKSSALKIEPSPRDTQQDRYALARAEIAEEDARTKRRNNSREEGRWVLAEDVERTAARLMSQQVSIFETVLRDAARKVADRLGVDFREARQILMQEWRAHQLLQAAAMNAQADNLGLSEKEQAEDV